MATTKCLSLICEIPNFANAYLGKVTKFQGYGLFPFGVLSDLLAWRWKTHPPGINRVKFKLLIVGGQGSGEVAFSIDLSTSSSRINVASFTVNFWKTGSI